MSSQPLLGGGKGAAPLPGSASIEDFEARCTVFGRPALPPSPRRRLYEGAFWLGTPVLLGALIGALLPINQQCPTMPDAEARASSIIGWTYFCAWSISFYPQAYLNWRRKSVAGLSLDFQLLNLLGFGCYAVYNAALFWDPRARAEYECTHGGAPPAVHANDVFFALHAAAVTALTLVQCALYDRGGQRVSLAARVGVGAAVAAIAAYLAAVLGAAAQEPRHPGGPPPETCSKFRCADAGGGLLPSLMPCGNLLSYLSLLYFLSYIKLAVSLVKYIPQVYLNYRLRSTAGWNMHNVALDFGGGALSLVQLVLDGAATHDWSAVTGNPVKFGLGFASMFFDVIFMLQHFVWYPAATLAGDLWGAADPEAGLPAGGAKAKEAAAAAAGGVQGALPPPLPRAPSGGELEAAGDAAAPADTQPLLR